MLQLKPPITYNQQIEKLRSRGCLIDDTNFCTQVFSQINYYRLSAYFLPFKNPEGNYLPGTKFNDIYQIYSESYWLSCWLGILVKEIRVFIEARHLAIKIISLSQP